MLEGGYIINNNLGSCLKHLSLPEDYHQTTSRWNNKTTNTCETYDKENNPKIPHVFKSSLLMDSAAFVCKVSPFSDLCIKQIPNSSILRQYLYGSRLRYGTILPSPREQIS
jgi:hypothetical protein